MAELQAIAAAGEITKLALQTIIFLNKVRTADNIANEVHERTSRLKRVVENIRNVLELRIEKGVAPQAGADEQTVENICECIEACGNALRQVENKVGGFPAKDATGTALLEKFKLACKHSGIKKSQQDLEARISALQTDLSVLQLTDHAHTHATVGQNHETVLEVLATLRLQIDNGNKLLHGMLSQHRKQSAASVPDADAGVAEHTPNVRNDIDDGAIDSLVDSLRMAEDYHERYTSEYAPTAPSEIGRRGVDPPSRRNSISAPATPRSDTGGSIPLSHTNSSDDLVPEEEYGAEDTPPLPLLSRYIEAAHERAVKERDQGHFNQAEVNLQSAIRYSEMRERHHSVTFTDRVWLQEEVAQLYQKQGKFGEAVAKVHQLLRETPEKLDQARQHQLLGAIYFERHQSRNGPALSNSTDDAANAEKYAQKAFNTRFKLLETSDLPTEDVERHYSCTVLLARIMETRDKTVEASELMKLVTEGSSMASESIRRISTAQTAPSEASSERTKQQQLIAAIQAGESEQVQSLLDDSDVEIDRLSKEGKTPLFYAVECSDETIVHKLLDPENGADVNKCNKKGVTALHHAAGLGLHDMVRCLLHHDAEINAVDTNKDTPLMKAVRRDQSTVAQVLCDNGANMEASGADEWSVLHLAVRLATSDMINLLLDLTPELKDAVDTRGMTALHHCAEEGLVGSSTALLTHRNPVDVAAVDSFSRSALYFAASKPPDPEGRRESMVRLLVDKGARISETRPPPRWRDYDSLKRFQVPRRVSKDQAKSASKPAIDRHDSVSTVGTVGTTSTGKTKLSRIFSSKMQLRRRTSVPDD